MTAASDDKTAAKKAVDDGADHLKFELDAIIANTKTYNGKTCTTKDDCLVAPGSNGDGSLLKLEATAKTATTTKKGEYDTEDGKYTTAKALTVTNTALQVETAAKLTLITSIEGTAKTDSTSGTTFAAEATALAKIDADDFATERDDWEKYAKYTKLKFSTKAASTT